MWNRLVVRLVGGLGRGASLGWLVVAAKAIAQTDQLVYTDSLQNGWQNWSWATVNLASSAVTPHGGASCISVSSTNWQALYLHHTTQDAAQFTNLTFWTHGGSTGGQSVQVQATRAQVAQSSVVVLSPLTANSWRKETVSLAALGVATATDFDGFWLQVQNSGLAPTFYVDDITLIAATNAASGTSAPVAISINAALNVHPISPLIYGVAFATSNQLAELNAPVNRAGGNAESRYNWQLNARNHAADWYFQSLSAGAATPGAAADEHVAHSKNGGAAAMLTVPMLGWMPKLGPGRGKLSSYSIAKYGPQTGNDSQWFADAGNGVGTNSTNHTSWLITTNDPTDAHFLTNSAFQQAWMQHLTNRWGLSTNGGVRYYCMDNEHTLWNSTHRDVHPVGATMAEVRDKFFDYGEKVKGVDPSALLLAPEEWGWNGYLYSGFDAQWASANNDWNPAHFPDRGTNGGMEYMAWFLDQARLRELNTGRRLLDYFTLHIYPQGAGEFTDDVSTSTQLGRNRSTRAFWDPSYVDQSWINSVIKLIPRMKAWVASNYPGTKLGITEYNWGAEGHINGATAQADILGILGREGVDLATRWTTPEASTPTFKAMKLFRNYDGNQSTFGDLSVAASVPNPDNVAAFAARRSSDGALTVLVINKQLTTAAPLNLSLTGFLPAGSAQVWQLTAANVITPLSNLNFTGGSFSNTVPAQSLTLFVLPAGVPPGLQALGVTISNTFGLRLNGRAGERYVLWAGSNLVNWLPVQTNVLGGSAQDFSFPLSPATRFFRAQWLP